MNNTNLQHIITKDTNLTDQEAYCNEFNNPDTFWIDHYGNFKNFKEPQNLVEENTVFMSDNKLQYDLNPNEIISSIKAVNRGISYSNKFIEDQWKLRQMNQNFSIENINGNMLNHNSYYNSSNDTKENLQNNNTSELKNRIENIDNSNSIQEILKQCKLSKNALIIGLLNNNQINITDLQRPMKPNVKRRTFYDQVDYETEEDTIAGYHLVQHPNDPDIYLHPLQLADKSKQHTNLIREKITPKQYYINNSDKMSFEFVKRNIDKK